VPFLPKVSDANTIHDESKTLSLLHTGGHIEITGLPWWFQCSLHNSKNCSSQRATTFA